MSDLAQDLDLTSPPWVEAQGRATHGTVSLVDEFRLPDLWSLHLYDYRAQLEVDGVPYAISPGLVSLVPPGSLIRYRYEGPSTHLYAHLRGRRADPRTGANGATGATGATGRLQLIMHPGTDLPVITDLMRSAVDSAATTPERTRADVWMALLRLSARRTDPPTRRSPTEQHLAAAMTYVERHLSEPLTVPDIAAAVGVSHHHLTRLFRAERGVSVVGYLRRRRVEHARRLLEQSTMSIGAIAASVGVPDLQAFNKLCRAVTGHGPRALRARTGRPDGWSPTASAG